MLKIFILAISLGWVIPAPAPTPSVINSLQEGGYILYARHGEATIGSDQEQLILGDCSTQRNLSAEGKRQAVAYGENLRRLAIPIQYPVAASPLCRTTETAELAFGKQNVQQEPLLENISTLSSDTPPMDQKRVLAELTSILEVIPPAGKNKVIIGHGFPKGVGLGDIPYMGTVMLKPRGKGKGYDVIGTIPLAEWMNMRILN